MTARARARGHSLSRRLVSNDTFRPRSRASAKAAKTVSHAESLIAWLMPEACTMRAAAIVSAGRLAGVSRLAAEPARK